MSREPGQCAISVNPVLTHSAATYCSSPGQPIPPSQFDEHAPCMYISVNMTSLYSSEGIACVNPRFQTTDVVSNLGLTQDYPVQVIIVDLGWLKNGGKFSTLAEPSLHIKPIIRDHPAYKTAFCKILHGCT